MGCPGNRVRAGLLFTVNHKVGFSKFQNLEKSSKINENSIARQNGSVKMIATTIRTLSDQHPGTKNPKTSRKISKTFLKIFKIPTLSRGLGSDPVVSQHLWP